MTHLKEGDKAPIFKGIDQNGNLISLDDFKDDTPGCTAEACNLNDNYSLLTDKTFIGVHRTTYIISTEGIIKRSLLKSKQKSILLNYKME